MEIDFLFRKSFGGVEKGGTVPSYKNFQNFRKNHRRRGNRESFLSGEWLRARV